MINRKKIIIPICTLFAGLFITSSVYGKQINIKFTNNRGTNYTSVYSNLNRSIEKDGDFILPPLPIFNRMENIDWSITQNATKADFKEGQTVIVHDDVTFYAVRKWKYDNIRFHDQDGKDNNDFVSRNLKVKHLGKYALPSVPYKPGYKALGWSHRKNNRTGGPVGKWLIAKRDVDLYAVYVRDRQLTVTYKRENGSVIRTDKVYYGDPINIPSKKNTANKVFIGWKTSPYGYVEYSPGDSIILKNNLVLYEKYLYRANEYDPKNKFTRINNKIFSRIIFVGDSRTHQIEKALKQVNNNNTPTNNYFIAKGNMGLYWLKTEAFPMLLQTLKQKHDFKPTAIVFNLGVNDLHNMNEYASYLNSIAPILRANNAKLYFMSVNPINDKIKQNHKRSNADIKKFNRTIREKCSANYKYIDVYGGTMMKDGFNTFNPFGIDDGLHYSKPTSRRIYSYTINQLNSGL